MKLVTGITPQEDFPRADLTLDNAELLALLLSHEATRKQGHTQAEATVLLFRLGHSAITEASKHLENASTRELAAFHCGIALYETISTMVRTQAPQPDMETVFPHARKVASTSSHSFYAYLSEATERFQAEQPNTRTVVSEASERFYPFLSSYAHSGAALARQFELDVE